jgi:hypothetical protein
MRLLRTDIDKRLCVKLDKSIKADGVKGIMKFGEDNDYPQIIERLIGGSITATCAKNIYASFLTGLGFENQTINEIVIGKDIRGKKITILSLLKQVAQSIAYNNGVYLLCNENLDRKIGDVKIIPFKYCRFSKPDDMGFSAKIGVYENWDKESGVKFEDKKIKWYHTFNLEEKVFTAQVAEALNGEELTQESIKKFKGQIYFEFLDNTYLYPLSPIDEIYLDCDTENQISIFKNNTTRNGMLKKTVLRVAEPKNKEDQEELEKNITKFLGTDGPSTLILTDEVDPATGEIKKVGAFAIDTIESNIDDKIFEGWQKELINNIRKAFKNLPAILIDYEESKLGTTSGEAIIQATNFYNAMTSSDRSTVSAIFKEIFTNSMNNLLSSNQNWNIKPLSLYGTNTDLVAANSDQKNIG